MIAERFGEWAEVGEELHAPALLPYEAASALTRLIAAGQLAGEVLPEAWAAIGRAPISYHALSDGAGAVELALRLGATAPTTPRTSSLRSSSTPSSGHSTARSRAMRLSAGCPCA